MLRPRTEGVRAMPRELAERLCVRGTLVALTPVHVGGVGETVETDLPLARDGRGDLYIPGTSLAGALRAWCQSAFDQHCVQATWGFQDGDQGHAARLIVEDGKVGPDSLVPEIRDHVGIDREWGTAAEHIKYDRAILPRGATIGLTLTLEVDVDGTVSKAMLGHLLTALAADSGIRIGAAKTRGLGRVRLEDRVHVSKQCLGTPEGILAALTAGEEERHVGKLAEELIATDQSLIARGRPRIDVTLDWEPDGPLMVKAGYDGMGVDSLPLTSGNGDGLVSLVLPGSSVKGALRSQAERIVRTVCDTPLPAENNPRKRFLKHLEVPLIESLFGAPGKSAEQAGEATDSTAGLGALAVDDCYAKHRIPTKQWEKVTTAQDERSVKKAAYDACLTKSTPAVHVAVDRWTGGAAESLLFSVLEPHAIKWEPIRLTVDLARLPKAEEQPALALLYLLIRDLGDGRIPLGYSTNRGMGAVKLRRACIHATDLADGDRQYEYGPEADPARVVSCEELAQLEKAWTSWIAGQNRREADEPATARDD